MNKYRMVIEAGRKWLPKDEHVAKVIFENNKEFNVAMDEYGMTIIECENQPRPMKVFGISWEKVD